MLDLTDLLRRTQAANTHIETAEYRGLLCVNVKDVLTPPDRIRLKKDDMLTEGAIEGPMALLMGGWIMLGLSSARVKV